MNTAIREVVARVLGLAPERVDPTTRPAYIDGWDSARFVDLVLALEERLGFQFDIDELAAMRSVGDTEDLARQRT